MGKQLALFGAMAAAAVYAVRGPSSQVFGGSRYRGSKKLRQVALTFDDGPTPATMRLLDLLASLGVEATFFQCGLHVRRYPEIARAVVLAGHEVGNHTDTHPHLWTCTPEMVVQEITLAQRSIEVHAGVSPKWFRAPYGVRWFGLRRAQRQLNLTGMMWTTIAGDWKLSSDGVLQRLLNGLNNGAVLCLHDGRARNPNPDISVTLAAVGQFVPRALDAGFRFRTVSQLFSEGNPDDQLE